MQQIGSAYSFAAAVENQRKGGKKEDQLGNIDNKCQLRIILLCHIYMLCQILYKEVGTVIPRLRGLKFNELEPGTEINTIEQKIKEQTQRNQKQSGGTRLLCLLETFARADRFFYRKEVFIYGKTEHNDTLVARERTEHAAQAAAYPLLLACIEGA